MIRGLIRFLLSAVAFAFILPLIPGISFHGNFWAAIGAALIFAIVGFFVDLVAIMISAMITVGSLGLALLWLIPLWLIGFWLLPAVTLKLVADMMPANFTVQGWLPAAEGGLVLLLIGALTGRRKK